MRVPGEEDLITVGDKLVQSTRCPRQERGRNQLVWVASVAGWEGSDEVWVRLHINVVCARLGVTLLDPNINPTTTGAVQPTSASEKKIN